MAKQFDLDIEINRDAPAPALLPFTEYFKGFEKVGAVRRVFGKNAGAVLEKLKIGFISNKRMYMGIRDEDGSIGVGTYHLEHSDVRTLYLDVVHELFHVRQRMEDSGYFHREHMKFMGDRSLYYASPIEVPAYRHTVREAERIGMSYDEIVGYLKMGPVPPKIFNRFLRQMEINPNKTKHSRSQPAKLPVSIRRNPSLTYYPFSDYFKGFEKVPAVRKLFGERTEESLGRLRVEFVASPFATIFPNEDDGHPVVDPSYLRKGDTQSIYLDVLLCLNASKRAIKRKVSSDSVDRELDNSSVIFESYKAMVEEARRIGVPEPEILEHLRLPKFVMTPAGYEKLLRALGLSNQR
jgi:hypothetical protein